MMESGQTCDIDADSTLIDCPPPGMVHVETGRADAPAEQPRHRHALGQVQIVEQGLMAVETGAGWWTLPPGRVGWLPPGWPHAGRAFGAVRLKALYLDGRRAALLAPEPKVFALSPFLAALIGRLGALGATDDGRRARLLDVLCDELMAADVEPVHLPLPREPRLARLCRALAEHPDDPRDLDAWARHIGLSRRSLSRRLLAETGLSFGRWRTQARLMAALPLLAERCPVTEVALAVGFDSVSSFITSFRRHFGTTPARYLGHRR